MAKDGAMAEKSKQYEAAAQVAKVQRADDAKKALSEYEASAAALRAKTERLKALRLAKTPPRRSPRRPPGKAKAARRPPPAA